MAENDTMISSPDFIPSNVTLTTDANSVYTSTVSVAPKQVKGGVFAPADIELIKRALDVYKTKLLESEESERTPSQELVQLANLLHRINNRI